MVLIGTLNRFIFTKSAENVLMNFPFKKDVDNIIFKCIQQHLLQDYRYAPDTNEQVEI